MFLNTGIYTQFLNLHLRVKRKKEKEKKDIGRLQPQLIECHIVLQYGPTFFSLYKAYIQILDFSVPTKVPGSFFFSYSVLQIDYSSENTGSFVDMITEK